MYNKLISLNILYKTTFILIVLEISTTKKIIFTVFLTYNLNTLVGILFLDLVALVPI